MDYRANFETLINFFKERKADEVDIFSDDLKLEAKGRYNRVRRAKAIVSLLISTGVDDILFDAEFYRMLGLIGRDIYVVVFAGVFLDGTQFAMPSTRNCMLNFTNADKRYRKFLKSKGGVKLNYIEEYWGQEFVVPMRQN